MPESWVCAREKGAAIEKAILRLRWSWQLRLWRALLQLRQPGRGQGQVRANICTMVVSRRIVAHPPLPSRAVRPAAAAVRRLEGAAVGGVQAFYHTRGVRREDNASRRGRVEPWHVPIGQRA